MATQIDIPTGKQLGEWAIDLAITYAGYHIAKGMLMTSGVDGFDQPLALLATLGITFGVFKLARQWKALD